MQFYHLENGTYRLRMTALASISNAATYSRYQSYNSLSAGKWRVRAYMPADAAHAATYTAYRYVSVR
jgi:hypothetical protein